ncbi:hypothetical protein GQ53DRAFT_875380, partial [Thozetella sp. PMI_491]
PTHFALNQSLSPLPPLPLSKPFQISSRQLHSRSPPNLTNTQTATAASNISHDFRLTADKPLLFPSISRKFTKETEQVEEMATNNGNQQCVGQLLVRNDDVQAARFASMPNGHIEARYTGDGSVGDMYLMLSDGPRLLPTDIYYATYTTRGQLEPGAQRYFLQLAMQWIDTVRTPAIVVSHLETAIRLCDVTSHLSSQRIYRNLIDAPLREHAAPNFLAVRALWCLSFGRLTTALKTRLHIAGYDWMTEPALDYAFTGMSVRRIRRNNEPALQHDLVPFLPIVPVELKVVQLNRQPRRRPARPRPVYTVHPTHITVRQSAIRSTEFLATEEEMNACPDRIQQTPDGTVTFMGPQSTGLKPSYHYDNNVVQTGSKDGQKVCSAANNGPAAHDLGQEGPDLRGNAGQDGEEAPHRGLAGTNLAVAAGRMAAYMTQGFYLLIHEISLVLATAATNREIGLIYLAAGARATAKAAIFIAKLTLTCVLILATIILSCMIAWGYKEPPTDSILWEVAAVVVTWYQELLVAMGWVPTHWVEAPGLERWTAPMKNWDVPGFSGVTYRASQQEGRDKEFMLSAGYTLAVTVFLSANLWHFLVRRAVAFLWR